jgi:putative copper resistance protein D
VPLTAPPLPALSGTQILTSWRLDVPAAIAVVVLGGAYGYGVLRLRRRGERWGWWPSTAFLVLGLGSVVLATMSCLGVYDRELFWARAVQYTVLLALSPLLLAMGEPLELSRRCLGSVGSRRLSAALRSWPMRLASFPLTGALLGVLVLLVLYLSPLFGLALRSEVVHHLVWLLLFAAGAVFFVPELDSGEDLLPAWCGYPARMAFSIVDGLVDALPGIVVMTMHGTLAAAYYRGLQRTWGPAPHWDQTIGGALMLTLAEAIALPFLVVLFVRWARADEQAGHYADLQLDPLLGAPGNPAPGNAAAASGGGASAQPGDAGSGPATRPWWETDPGPLAQRPGWHGSP